MRTIEAATGLLIIAAAIALACGAGSLLARIPPAGFGLTLAVSSLGATIAAHGMSGRATGNHGTAGCWRTGFYLLLAITLAATLPLIVDILNLTSIAGFPLGYYASAQGLLILLAIIAFRAATHLDRLDTDAPSAPAREDD